MLHIVYRHSKIRVRSLQLNPGKFMTNNGPSKPRYAVVAGYLEPSSGVRGELWGKIRPHSAGLQWAPTVSNPRAGVNHG
jgi:hypothetical protein